MELQQPKLEIPANIYPKLEDLELNQIQVNILEQMKANLFHEIVSKSSKVTITGENLDTLLKLNSKLELLETLLENTK